MSQTQESLIVKKYLDHQGVQEAMHKAVLEALQDHKIAGNKVPIWDNGEVIYVEPELS